MKLTGVASLVVAFLVATAVCDSEEVKPKGRKNDPILAKLTGFVQKLIACRADDTKTNHECLNSHMESMKEIDFDHALPIDLSPFHNSSVMATFRTCFGKLTACHGDAQGDEEAIKTCANEAMKCITQGKSEDEFISTLPPILKKLFGSYSACKKNYGEVKCIQQHMKRVKKMQAKLAKKESASRGSHLDNENSDGDDGIADESVPDVAGVPNFKALANMFKKCFNKLVHCHNQDLSIATTCMTEFRDCMPEPPTNLPINPANLKQSKAAAVWQCIVDYNLKYGTVEDSKLLHSFVTCVSSKNIGGLPHPLERHGFCYRNLMQRPHASEDDAEECLEQYTTCLGQLYGDKKDKKRGKNKSKGKGKRKGEKANGGDKAKVEEKPMVHHEHTDGGDDE